MTNYKAILRALTDYGDIIYDQTQNESFLWKQYVRYKATLAIIHAIQGTSPDKIFQELEPESLKSLKSIYLSIYIWKKELRYTKLNKQ